MVRVEVDGYVCLKSKWLVVLWGSEFLTVIGHGGGLMSCRSRQTPTHWYPRTLTYVLPCRLFDTYVAYEYSLCGVVTRRARQPSSTCFALTLPTFEYFISILRRTRPTKLGVVDINGTP